MLSSDRNELGLRAKNASPDLLLFHEQLDTRPSFKRVETTGLLRLIALNVGVQMYVSSPELLLSVIEMITSMAQISIVLMICLCSSLGA